MEEVGPQTTLLEDNTKETTDNEDGKGRETEPLTTFSTEQKEGITPTIAKTTSNVEGLNPFGNIRIFLFFHITSLKLFVWC